MKRSLQSRRIDLPGRRVILPAAFALLLLCDEAIAQDRRPEESWPKAAPEAIGLVPTNLADLDADVAREKFGLLDSMLVIRCGTVGFERSYSRDYRQIYGEAAQKRRMTLRNLMTMTTGLERHEDLAQMDPKNSANIMEGSHDWARYTIDQPMASEPGSVWMYNSGAAQVLSHVFTRVTGKRIDEYAAEYLFKPLKYPLSLELTPTGLPDTEGGLYLSPRDLAKIGYLFLKNGKWDGKQIVSAEWVKASVTPQVTTGEGSAQYGYMWWLHPYGNSPVRFAWAAHGFGQQHLVILPDYEWIIVVTGWDILPSDKDRESGWLERMLSTVDKRRTCASNENKSSSELPPVPRCPNASDCGSLDILKSTRDGATILPFTPPLNASRRIL